MQRHLALWAFPLFSLAVVVGLTVRGGRVIDAPDEPARATVQDTATLLERNANLSRTLERAAEARQLLEQHVVALRDEVREMRAARTALQAEAELWRDSYELVAQRFDQLAVLAGPGAAARVERELFAPVHAGFTREDEPSTPRPLQAVIVR